MKTMFLIFLTDFSSLLLFFSSFPGHFSAFPVYFFPMMTEQAVLLFYFSLMLLHFFC